MITVLFVSGVQEDEQSLRNILTGPDWWLHRAGTYREARQNLLDNKYAAVITEARLDDNKGWVEIADEVRVTQGSCPVIVVSRYANSELWSEVLNLGGFDLFAKPLERSEVLSVLEYACHRRTDHAELNGPVWPRSQPWVQRRSARPS